MTNIYRQRYIVYKSHTEIIRETIKKRIFFKFYVSFAPTFVRPKFYYLKIKVTIRRSSSNSLRRLDNEEADAFCLLEDDSDIQNAEHDCYAFPENVETVDGIHNLKSPIVIDMPNDSASGTETTTPTGGDGTETTTPTGGDGTETTTPTGSEGTETTTPTGGDGTETTTPTGGDGTETTTPTLGDGTETTTPTGSDGTETTTPTGGDGTETTTPTGGDGTETTTPVGPEQNQTHYSGNYFYRKGSTGLSAGGIVGIILGCIAALAIIIAVILCMNKKPHPNAPFQEKNISESNNRMMIPNSSINTPPNI